MAASVRVACLQLTPNADLVANTAGALVLAREAIDAGAKILFTPEHAAALDGRGSVMRLNAVPEADHPFVRAFQDLATRTGCWVLIGSVVVPVEDGRLANRSLLLNDEGSIVARYDKIHMFDIALPNGRELRESRTYNPGTEARIAETPWGLVGMTICYDVRFPHLSRALARGGASVIAVPSAFTRPTGKDHWHVLLRARAIETGCFVIAPATCGEHPGEHSTYGHSLVVDPWGRILAEAGEAPQILLADLDLSAVVEVRRRLPSLQHDRTFAHPPEGLGPLLVPA